MSLNMHTETHPMPQADATGPRSTNISKNRDQQAPPVREAKAQADRLTALFAARGVKLRRCEALEGVAALHGERDWNTLIARLQTQAALPENFETRAGFGAQDSQVRAAGIDLSDADGICESLIQTCFGELEKPDMWAQRSISLIRAVVPALCLRAVEEGAPLSKMDISTGFQTHNALDLLRWAHQDNPTSREYQLLRAWFCSLPGFDLAAWFAGEPVHPRTLDQYGYAAMALTVGLNSIVDA